MNQEVQASPNVARAPMRAQALECDELSAWMRLAMAPQLGPIRIRRLLGHFGLPQHVLQARRAALEPYVGVAIADFLLAPQSEAFRKEVDRVRRWLETPHHHLVVLGDAAYPPALLESPDPPPMLYVSGRLELLHPGEQGQPAVSIVGSRRATHAGKLQAERFARALGEAGVTIVSGLAMGIDAVAHTGALDTPGGTVAVVGTGADRTYPQANVELAEQIAVHGAVLSEWPLGTAPRPAHFPRRNRVIAALGVGVLVVEATPHSGSLITAQLALDYGRDVYAIPGSIDAPYKRGCNRLIREGALLVETPADLLAALGLVCPEAHVKPARQTRSLLGGKDESRMHPAPPREEDIDRVRHTDVRLVHRAGSTSRTTRKRGVVTPELPADPLAVVVNGWISAGPVADTGLPISSATEDPCATAERDDARDAVLSAMGHDPVPLDVLAARTGLDGARVQAAVLALELEGQIEWLSSGRLSRIVS